MYYCKTKFLHNIMCMIFLWEIFEKLMLLTCFFDLVWYMISKRDGYLVLVVCLLRLILIFQSFQVLKLFWKINKEKSLSKLICPARHSKKLISVTKSNKESIWKKNMTSCGFYSLLQVHTMYKHGTYTYNTLCIRFFKYFTWYCTELQTAK